MNRATTFVVLVLVIAGVSAAAPRLVGAGEGKRAEFAGLVCVPLNPEQLQDVEQAYGEPAGVFVEAVTAQSFAAQSGAMAGDILISVRMPGEDEFYPIPPGFDDMMMFCEETDPAPGIEPYLIDED